MSTATLPSIEWSAAQLDELFASSPAGEIPAGRGKGTAVIHPGGRATKPLAAVTRVGFWQGKVFRPTTGDLKNMLSPFSLLGIRAEVYTAASWYDNKPCIVLDYSKSSKLAGRVRDEIREVAPGHYLGVVYLGARRTRVYFFLDFE